MQDPHNESKLATATKTTGTRKLDLPMEEIELSQKAKEYNELQKRKTVKWFRSQGIPLPTEEDLLQLHKERQEKEEGKAAAAREADRSRIIPDASSNPPAVPGCRHPLYESEPDPSRPPITFSPVAASGLDGRKALQDSFVTLCRKILLRKRVERRLQLAAREQMQSDGPVVSRKRDSHQDIPNLTLLQLPNLLSSATSKPITASFAEKPSEANLEVFRPRPLCVPFEYKQKAYRPLKFLDHHFVSADPEEEIIPLPGGRPEVPEEKSVTPIVEHFVQPLVTLDAYPMQPFSLSRTMPWSRVVEGSAVQPLSDGGFFDPYLSVDYNHSTPSCLPALNTTDVELFRAPLPKIAKKRDVSDELSDSDDDEDIVLLPPQALQDVSTWLPAPRRGNPRRETIASETTQPCIPEQQLLRETMPIDFVGTESNNATTHSQRQELESAIFSFKTSLPENLQQPF